MILQGLIAALSRASTFDDALVFASRNADFSLTDGLRAPLLAGLLARRAQSGLPQALLVITATGRESESVRAALASVVPNAEIIEFPAWETLPHERLSPSAEIVGKRLLALHRLAEWQAGDRATPIIMVASVRAALQPVADNLTDYKAIELAAAGRGFDLGGLAMQLVDLAYSRVDMVTRRGEFAVRGRNPRRVPAHGRASVSRGLLRRRGRADPPVLGRRPALPPRRDRLGDAAPEP